MDFIVPDDSTRVNIGGDLIIGDHNYMLAPFDITGDATNIGDRHEGIWLRGRTGGFIVQINVRGSRLEIGGGGSLDTTPAMSVDYLTNNVDITGDITVGGTVDGIDVATDVAANTSKSFATFNPGRYGAFDSDGYPSLDNTLGLSHTRGFIALKDGEVTGISWQARCSAYGGSPETMAIVLYIAASAVDTTAGTSISSEAKLYEVETYVAGAEIFSQGDVISCYVLFPDGSPLSDGKIMREMIILIQVKYY